MLPLRNLGYMLALDRHRNFARAAAELGITQPALTRAIQSLEQQLDMKLFDRDRSGVRPTPQGREVIARAATLLADADDLETYLDRAAHGETGSVRFGMTPMPARALLPQVVSDGLSRTPEVTQEVSVRDADALWNQLMDGRIEFFVTNEGYTFEGPEPRKETIGRFPIGGIVRAGHPLLSGTADDARFPVVRSSWSGLPLPASLARRMLGTANIIEDFGVLSRVTETSDAIWYSSSYTVVEELRTGTLSQLPAADDDEPRDVGITIYSLARRTPSPLANAVKRIIQREVTRLQAEAGS